MKAYSHPSVELIEFAHEKIIALSGCDCFYNITNHDLNLGGNVACEAESGGAIENPWGIKAPEWVFG